MGSGNWSYAEKYLRQPLFKSFEIINPNFVLIQMQRTEVELTSLIVAGMSVLEISKTLLYSMFYDEIKAAYGNQAVLNYCDTDGLLFTLTQHIPEKNEQNNEIAPLLPCFYNNFIKNHPRLFDLSNYDDNSKFKLSNEN